MKKNYFILFFLVLFAPNLNAQRFLGLINSNYAGVNGVQYNPASIADSRHRFHMNWLTLGVDGTNNMYAWNGASPLSIANGKDPGEITNNNLTRRNKGTVIGQGVDIRMPFSFMMRFDRDNSMAFTFRIRQMITVNNISDNLSNLLERNLNKEEFKDSNYSGATFNANAHAFMEFGGTYARTIFDKGKHYLKGGLTFKYLVGIGAGGANISSIKYSVKNENTGTINEDVLRIDNAQGRIAISERDRLDTFTTDDVMKRISQNRGIGFDIGFVYEYRPNIEKFKYKMDGEDLFLERRNKYKYRIGFAITDIGGIRYKTGQGYNINVNSQVKLNDSEYSKFDETTNLNTYFGNQVERFETFRMGLPTTMNVNFDYHIWKRFYGNFMIIQNLRGVNAMATRFYSLMALTPRFEMGRLELALPISLKNNYSQLDMGACVRLGPLMVGSDNLFNMMGVGKVNGASFYMGLSFGFLPKKPKRDKDKDGISDKIDDCPDIAGLWQFEGCPDTDGDCVRDIDDACPTEYGLPSLKGCPDKDGDGIKDAEDECPNEAGKIEFKGCPDTDNDGLKDSEDECPNDAGKPELKGCPDTDNDGIKNKDDDCPEQAGLPQFKGCPDTDEDGVSDKEDECPNEKGKIELKGCPDTDGDGVADKKDECPTEIGSIELKGCPDKDKDGIADKDDKCPDVAGVKELEGCPPPTNEPILTKEEKETLKEAFDNLEFETGSAIIKKTSFESLKQLAEVLQKRNEYKLRISGHTDNVGNANTNLLLSQQRANAIKTFLIKEKIDGKRLITEGFGQSKPISDNTSEQGRQKNRRVEMKIEK